MAEQLNLYQKIADVKANIDGFTKDTKSYNYSYVSGSQVLHKIREKMVEHNLLLIPSTSDEQHELVQNGKGKPEHVVTMKLNYTWINADNPEEKHEVTFWASGQQDDISKAHGTALTYAERYFLMKFFNLPTDEDDADAKQKKAQYSAKATQQEVGEFKKEVIAFSDLMKENGRDVTPAQVKDQLGITDPTQESQESLKQAIATLNKWTNQTKNKNKGSNQ